MLPKDQFPAPPSGRNVSRSWSPSMRWRSHRRHRPDAEHVRRHGPVPAVVHRRVARVTTVGWSRSSRRTSRPADSDACPDGPPRAARRRARHAVQGKRSCALHSSIRARIAPRCRSLGYQQIYRTLHEMPGVAADRAMLPDEGSHERGLVTLETGQPVAWVSAARVLGRLTTRDRRRRRHARARERPGARRRIATIVTRS